MSTSNRWYLSAPTGPDGDWLGTALSRAERYEGHVPLHVAIYQPGPELELTETDAVLVVNLRVARIIESGAAGDVQLLPAQVDGASGPHFAVNVLRTCSAHGAGMSSWSCPTPLRTLFGLLVFDARSHR